MILDKVISQNKTLKETTSIFCRRTTAQRKRMMRTAHVLTFMKHPGEMLSCEFSFGPDQDQFAHLAEFPPRENSQPLVRIYFTPPCR